MPHVLTPIPVIAALVALLVLAGCGEPAPAAPVVVPSDVHLASVASPPPGESLRPWTGAPGSADAVRLEAARTVALYCHLLGRGQFARASDLCAGRRLWSRHALASLGRLRFRSARIYAAPDARTLVLKARVRTHAGRGRPLPDGLAVVFFTLGRAGSAVGGWRITAVSTSP